MSAVLKLVQGTEEWNEHRSQYRNASETPAVMGLSPWVSPFMLWEFKTGRKAQETSYIMRRGTELEPQARAAYESETSTIMEPAVMTEGDYSASLDGISLNGEVILEVKCPTKGKLSETWEEAAAGRVPSHYYFQIQTQLMVSGAKVCHFYVYDGENGLLVEVLPVLEDMDKLKTVWDTFMQFVTTDSPPPISEMDTVSREDEAWRGAALAYVSAKKAVENATAEAEHAKAQLVELTTHVSEQGFGVQVTKYIKNGNGKQEVRVTILKGG